MIYLFVCIFAMELHPGQKQANVQAILNSMYSMFPILL